MKREAIIKIIIEEQKVVIESLQKSVEQYKIASDLDEESTHDPEDFSHQTEAKDMQLRFEKTLKEAEASLTFLKGELKQNHDSIENGSLIETDQNFLFVGISVPVFEFEGKDVITFSENAPVFQNLRGKNIGELVEIGSNYLKILAFY